MSSAKPGDVNTKKVKWRENLPKADAQIGVPRALPFFHRPGTEKGRILQLEDEVTSQIIKFLLSWWEPMAQKGLHLCYETIWDFVRLLQFPRVCEWRRRITHFIANVTAGASQTTWKLQSRKGWKFPGAEWLNLLYIESWIEFIT